MKWEYLIIGIIFLTWTGLSFYAGRKSIKVIYNNPIDTVYLSKTDTIHKTITKFIRGEKDTVFIDSSHSFQTYGEIIDSTITFNSDSLDFVAEIIFDDSLKAFSNFFDFNLRTKKVFETIIHEVPIPYEAAIYQHPLVIVLGLIAAFLFGLAL